MFGLILGLLYIAYSILVHGTSVAIAATSALSFLWSWHVFWTWVEGIILALLFVGGLLATLFSKPIGVVISIFVVPLCAISVAIHQALFLGAVAIAQRADIVGAHPNVGYLGLAAVMYLIAIISQRGTVSAASKSKS